ncbi:hypothetical protein DD577_27145 [Klebsiella pneumoniae]|nr:hypothetical protein DD577_27145 [Klebsiella pneumoniae]
MPLNQVGGEFLPQINEGDLLDMPSTLPGISAAQAADILQKTDKLIMKVPEVARVFGKTGKEMVETTIQLKPQDQWRPGMTMEKIVEELDKTVRLPGLANLWVPPIRNRIDMLSTGIKSPIGIKVSGTNLADIDAIAEQIEVVARSVPGVTSALAERLVGGRYLNIDIHREKAARYGMTVGDVQLFVSSAIGGAMVGETVEGVERYPINIRYPQSYRDSPETLRQLPILTPLKQQIVLADVAEVKVVTGPSMLKTENARPTSWIYIDARDRDMVSVVHDLQQAIGKEVKLKPGISVSYSGQFELLERAIQKLKLMVPMTLMIIFVLLYLAFRRVGEALLIITSVPFALVGGIWFLYWMGFHLSVATGTGFIALAGVAAEFGVVMLMYLRHAIEAEPSLENPQTFSVDKLDEALYQGAVLRVRPKAMTVAVIIAGLLPILWGTGAGSEVMSRIAAPMIGGMITAPLLSLFIIPAAYKLMWLSRHRGKRSQQPAAFTPVREIGYSGAILLAGVNVPMNLNLVCYSLLLLTAVGSALLPYPLAMWFLLSSLLTWLIYGADKLAARKAWRRVPETTLLVLGLAGGWPGAILGQQCFRHKTQKQPFRTWFFISVALNVAALAGLYVVYTHLLSR